jgi:hypothetical protein
MTIENQESMYSPAAQMPVESTIPRQPQVVSQVSTAPKKRNLLSMFFLFALVGALIGGGYVYYQSTLENNSGEKSPTASVTPTTAASTGRQVVEFITSTTTPSVTPTKAVTYEPVCMPVAFDPKKVTYRKLTTAEAEGYWETDIYRITSIKNSEQTFDFSMRKETRNGFELTEYTFGCMSIFETALDVVKGGTRVMLLLDSGMQSVSADGKYIYVDGKLTDLATSTVVTIPEHHGCYPGQFFWNNGVLFTHSNFDVDAEGLTGDSYNEYKTTVCAWSTTGQLLTAFKSKLTWYGNNGNTLWALVGVLPKAPSVIYIYDIDETKTPHTCALSLQDTKNEMRRKTIDMFPIAADMIDLNRCPIGSSVELDVTETTFDNTAFRFKVVGDESYPVFKEFQTVK